jgi:HAE1 family hydrophobic/amphiphilic exporter-1
MNIVDLSIKRPVTVLMVSLAAIIFGFMAYFSLPVSLFPETKSAMTTVMTVYAGASPQVVEAQLTKPIEDQISSISGVDTIMSYSMDSVSIVVTMFKDGKDENLALQEVKDKIDAIQMNLPDGIEKSSISKMDVATSMPIMNIIMEGDMSPAELYDLASTTVRDQLSQVSGVGSVDISGGRKREIKIEFEKSAVFERFLSPVQAAGILAQANIEIPGGNITVDGEDVPVRFKGEFTSVEAIADLDMQTAAGTFKLRQLAEVKDTETKIQERTIIVDKKRGLRNEDSVLLRIQKNPSANTVSVVDTITKRLGEIEATAGGKIRLTVASEDASFIRSSVNDTLSNLIMGIILTGLVLMIFLHDWRSTLIISIAMPFSIIATFLVMQWMNISINILSLMGLSCAVGTLVANSVVVLENIFRHKEEGLPRAEAASKGAKEVIMAVLASTLTNVAVFVPLGGMSGLVGQMLSNFAYSVVISTVFSIIVSFTITPLLASRMIPEKLTTTDNEKGFFRRIGAALEKFFKAMETGYAASLKILLKNKRRCVLASLSVLLLFALSMVMFSRLPMEMLPSSDGGKIQIDAELPQGSGLEMTASVLKDIEEKIASYDEVENMIITLGSLGSIEQDVSVAQVSVVLKPKSERKRSNAELSAAMMKTLSIVPGAEIRVSAPSDMGLMNQTSAIDIYIQGPDTAVLQKLGEEIKRKAASVPGVMNAAINIKAGKSELVFEPKRKQISADGLTVQAIALSLRAAVDGLTAAVYREGGQEYDIRVKMKDSALKDIEDIRNIPIASKNGIFPLSRYADVSFEEGYNQIMRSDKTRTVELTADLLPGYAQGPVQMEVIKAIDTIEFPAGYKIGRSAMMKMMEDSSSGMIVVFITAILLVYMLLAAILENLVQPLFIITTIPLSLIGVAVACLVTNTILNTIAMISIVMLIGIVVNNAILLLDYANQLKREGCGAVFALIEAGQKKLKAILMSNIAIILGMVPMALGIGASMAELRKPMGIIVIGGIISSTVLTLWLIPALDFAFSGGSKGTNK